MKTRVFPGRMDSLGDISEFVTEAARQAGLNDAATYAVDLAVDEACTNIIEHGYSGEERGEISCSCEVVEQGLKITLHDSGRSFNPDKVPKPNLKAPLKQLKTRGAGLYLIRKMMDEVHFEFTDKTGNTLTMVKYK